MGKNTLNKVVVAIFAPVLILTGLAGFLLPAEKSLTSGAPLYNLFHVTFGIVGLIIALARSEWQAEAFNISFGLIDLYQAVAGYAHLFPEPQFRWTEIDNAVHVGIGLGLVIIGCYGAYHRRSATGPSSR